MEGGPDLADEQDILRFERTEDDWHSTPAGVELDLSDLGPWSKYFTSQRGFENLATFNTFSYVPHGYAMVKIDPKGVSQTPGTRWVPGQLAGDFYIAVEWCVEQPWCTGDAALVGSSYGENTQWAVASLKPKGLRCMPNRETSSKVIQFLNHHLKSEDCAAPERVGIQVRLGNQLWYWRKEKNWPVPGTQYTKWYLTTDNGVTTTPPTGVSEARFNYPAKSPEEGKSGISFHSIPFQEDVEFAGHFVAVLSLSSTAPDADVAVILWAVDESGRVVPYGASSSEPEPLAKGFLRVSHRKTDDSKSLPWRPWHTHIDADLAPLQGVDDVVEVTVEIPPAAARIRKGWTLRVDACPSENQPDIPGYTAPDMRSWYGETYEGQATDAIHVGGDRINYVLCPVVPKTEGYPNCII
ncbi:hypothetical protein IL306_010765 [Fusarium sp. DS 682]|nr:hypothetical protein IL306_010765 [Fusarium sp. DS 682]